MELGCPTARGWMAIPGGARHRCHQGLSQLLTPLPASSLGPALSLQPLSVHPGNSTAQLPVQKALKCRAFSPEEPLQEPLLHAAGFVPCLWHSLPSPRSGRGACWRRGAAQAQGCDPSWRGSTSPGMHCSSVRPHCLFPSSFPIAGHTQGNRRHLLEGALVSAALGLLRFPQQAQHYPCVCVCSAMGLPASRAVAKQEWVPHSQQFLPRVEGPPPRPKAWHEIRSGKQPQSWELALGVLRCVRSPMRAGTREGPCNSSAQLQQHRGAKPARAEPSHPTYTPRGRGGTASSCIQRWQQ